MIPLVDLRQQFLSIKSSIMSEVEKVIEQGQYIIGPKVNLLEQKLQQKLNVKHVITVANGTDALVLTLDGYGIGPGDEVITTPFSFFATAEAISRIGAKPVFADIDPHTYNLNPKEIEQHITAATKAILVVHLFGQPAEMKEICDIARKHRLLVIEDACQALGASYAKQPIGSLGDAACFSFFPSKNLGTMGDGGMVATSNDELAASLRQLRHHGSTKKYVHERIGYNSRLDELHAAILLVALQQLDDWNKLRIQRAQKYNEAFKSVSVIQLPIAGADRIHIYHLYCLRTQSRDELMFYLRKRGIQCAVYYPIPIHLQSAYVQLGYAKGEFPVAEQMSQCLLAIPMGPFLSKSDQDKVIAAVLSFEEECAT